MGDGRFDRGHSPDRDDSRDPAKRHNDGAESQHLHGVQPTHGGPDAPERQNAPSIVPPTGVRQEFASQWTTVRHPYCP
jgi:hypothetical protein